MDDRNTFRIPKNAFTVFPTSESKGRDSRRSFGQTQRKEILYQQDNKCAMCHDKLDPRATQFDHKKPWAAKGRTVTQNGRALCSKCHDIVTHQERLKKVDKRRKTKRDDPRNDPFGFGIRPLR